MELMFKDIHPSCTVPAVTKKKRLISRLTFSLRVEFLSTVTLLMITLEAQECTPTILMLAFINWKLQSMFQRGLTHHFLFKFWQMRKYKSMREFIFQSTLLLARLLNTLALQPLIGWLMGQITMKQSQEVEKSTMMTATQLVLTSSGIMAGPLIQWMAFMINIQREITYFQLLTKTKMLIHSKDPMATALMILCKDIFQTATYSRACLPFKRITQIFQRTLCWLMS